jgi:hypothetical protein
MKMRFVFSSIVFMSAWFLLFHSAYNLRAQDVEEHSFDRQAWQKAIDGLNYSDSIREVKKVRSDFTASPVELSNRQQWQRIILLSSCCVVLLFLLVYFIRKKGETLPGNSKTQVSFQQPEREFFPDDLLLRVQNAVQERHYKEAIRCYFLLTLQKLWEAKLIHWQKHKTNSEFSAELSATGYGESFVTVANRYEEVWYGDKVPDQHCFAEDEKLFHEFLKRINA